MKKVLISMAMAAFLAACNSNTDTTTKTATDTITKTDEVTTTKTDTTTHAAYTPSEGDVTRRDGKVMVWHDGEWKAADSDVHLSNGVVVNRKGEVVKEDKVVVLDDGEVVSKSGNFFDKAGNAIDDAWNATKKGVKKVGEGVKDVFTKDDTTKTKVKIKNK